MALLSNASSHLLIDLDLCGITNEFDAVVSSADIGIGKPAAGAFEAAAEQGWCIPRPRAVRGRHPLARGGHTWPRDASGALHRHRRAPLGAHRPAAHPVNDRRCPVPLPDPPLSDGDLTLRPWRPSEAAELVAAWSDPEVHALDRRAPRTRPSREPVAGSTATPIAGAVSQPSTVSFMAVRSAMLCTHTNGSSS